MARKKEPSEGPQYYKACRSKIEAVKNWRRNFWNGDHQWERMYSRFIGDHWTQKMAADFWGPSSDIPRINATVNLTGSDILNYMAYLFNRDPYFIVEQRREEDDLSSRIKQALVNTEWNDKRITPQLKMAGLDWLSIGHCVMKSGINIKLDAPRKPKTQGRIHYNDLVSEEAVYSNRISPYFFYYNPQCEQPNDPHTSRWCFEVVVKPKFDVLANEKYDSEICSDIEKGKYKLESLDSFIASTNKKKKISPFLKEEYDDTEDLVVLYEWWDKKFMRYCVFAGGMPIDSKPLYEGDWPYMDEQGKNRIKSFPYHKRDFIPVPNQPYGMGLPLWIEDDQDQVNRNRTSQNEHLRRSAARELIRKGSMEPSKKVKYTQGGPGTTVETESPEQDVKAAPQLTIPYDMYQMDAIYKNDIRELDGSSALSRGEGLGSRAPAAEVRALVSYHAQKLDQFVYTIDDLVTSIGYDMIDLMRAYYLKPRVVKIAGKDADYWQMVVNEDLAGEYDLKLESTSAEKHDPEMQAQRYQNAAAFIVPNYPMIAQILASEQPPVQLKLSLFLKKYFEVTLREKDVGRWFPPSLVKTAPLAAITEVEQMSQAASQPALSTANPQTQQLQAEGAGPDSALMGQLMGLIGGGRGQ